MPSSLFSILKTSRSVQFALGVCFVYWTYLACTVQVLIVFDAVGYEALGKLLSEQGWVAYFTTGPNREPLYPAMIALAMGFGKILYVPYSSILILMQVALGLITQVLTIILLLQLRVRTWLIALVTGYLAFSPIMTNVTFGILSESPAIPLMLALVLTYSKLWESFAEGTTCRSAIIFFSVTALTMTFVKGIFEVVTPLLMLPFIASAMRSFLQDQKHRAKSAIKVALIFLCLFYIPLIGYKLLNKKYNGEFTFTDRGSWAFYGNTHRRMQPLTLESLKVALSFAAGWGMCDSLWGREKCEFWSYKYSDDVGAQRRQHLSGNGLLRKEVNRNLMRESIEMILKNPAQYALLAGVESLKIIFSESLALGWAVFPPPVTHVYGMKPLALAIYFLFPVLTLSGLIHLMIYAVTHRNRPTDSPKILTNNILLLFAIYTLAYSNFLIVDRYTFLLIPFYVISIAFLADKTLARKQTPT